MFYSNFLTQHSIAFFSANKHILINFPHNTDKMDKTQVTTINNLNIYKLNDILCNKSLGKFSKSLL